MLTERHRYGFAAFIGVFFEALTKPDFPGFVNHKKTAWAVK
jgi:hypothetical protein